MLGFNRMTQTGKAKVVTIELSRHGLTHSDSRGRSTTRFDIVLDVYPDDGANAFRAETHHQFSPARFPDPGVELAVRCNPDKKKVEIDLSDDARYNPKIFRKENDRRFKEDHDRVLSEAPGTPPSDGSDDPELAELLGLEAQERAPKFGVDGDVNN
ncbi:MAG: hypothetical protein QOI10_2225 [Solirubrobacterales bacterium]|jgi:hypothetical protein|nr:hypothetical protein [Solirubrobacterales bacterium]